MKKLWRFSLLFLLMVSCLDLNTRIRIHGNGEASAKLVYKISREAANFGRGFGSDNPWPIPLTEKDFRQRAVQYEGISSIRYKSKVNKDGSETIAVSVRADSVKNLAQYMGLDISIQSDGKKKTFSLRFPPVEPSLQTMADSGILGAVESDVTMHFSLRPPRRPNKAEPGIIKGRWAELDLSMADILSGNSPSEWIVQW